MRELLCKTLQTNKDIDTSHHSADFSPYGIVMISDNRPKGKRFF